MILSYISNNTCIIITYRMRIQVTLPRRGGKIYLFEFGKSRCVTRLCQRLVKELLMQWAAFSSHPGRCIGCLPGQLTTAPTPANYFPVYRGTHNLLFNLKLARFKCQSILKTEISITPKTQRISIQVWANWYISMLSLLHQIPCPSLFRHEPFDIYLCSVHLTKDPAHLNTGMGHLIYILLNKLLLAACSDV